MARTTARACPAIASASRSRPRTAFGTGHHGTTRGCLLALDALARRRQRPRHILDLGTGSGVLAIAAAKLFRMPVLATDIDPRAVADARANAQRNGVGALVTVVHAGDLRAPRGDCSARRSIWRWRIFCCGRCSGWPRRWRGN